MHKLFSRWLTKKQNNFVTTDSGSNPFFKKRGCPGWGANPISFIF
jgi:hypothetical protein